jgi:SpoVK/Ycf46/Vps4 family AAA+-type ATPase
MPNDNEMMMGDEQTPVEDHRNPRRRSRDREPQPNEVGVHVVPAAHHALDRLVLQDEVRAEIATAVRSVVMADQLEAAWKLSQIRPMQGRCVINFYGPSGTGKTRAALGIALQLAKPLYQVDYSAIVSKYLGDTAKHIVLAFKQAKEAGAVLFFDEADSLLSRRVSTGESCSTSINQNRNTLMQELDRFGGVVIMTTNLFGNYDEAMLRRIARHVEFKLPDESMRQRLFRLHLPNPERTPADLTSVARAATGLSGGDILNVCLNAMEAASTDPDPANWRVTDELLMVHVRKVKSAKAAHSGQDRLPAPTGLN